MVQQEGAETARRILDEATGMFPNDPGGIGFWRYVREIAEIEGIEITETDLELSEPTRILCRADGTTIMFDWSPPG